MRMFSDEIMDVSKKLTVRPSTLVKYLNGELNKYAAANIVKKLSDANIILTKDSLVNEFVKSSDRSTLTFAKGPYKFSIWDFCSNKYRVQFEVILQDKNINANHIIKKILSVFNLADNNIAGVVSSWKNKEIINGIMFDVDKNTFLSKEKIFKLIHENIVF